MRQDEFNNVQVNNEKSITGAEFGKIQKTEFSENGDMYLHASNYNANLNQTIKNANIETFAETGSATGAVSGTATVVGGSTTAGGIAAGSVSVVVVASSVAVTAISVVTGVSIAMHDYKCDMKSLFISSNQMTCELTIDDLKDDNNDYDYELQEYDEEPCSIRVYNRYYDLSKKLHLGTNDITFESLTLGQTYNIVVTADNVSGGKKLYENQFTTAEVASFLDFDISTNFDSHNNVIYVSLDYVDELNQFSDFNLALSRLEEIRPIYADEGSEIEEENYDVYVANYALEKKTGQQEVHIEEQDMWIEPDMPYHYEFSYMKKEQKIIYKEGDIYFVDTSFYGEVYGVNFNNEANYQDGTFVLNLIYNDEKNVLSNFVLHLSRNDGFVADIPLEKTNEPQTIEASRYGIDFEYEYDATLTYLNNGKEETKYLSTFSFEDNSGPRSVFNDFLFSGYADFVEKTFEVRIDYQDDLNIFRNFVLIISDNYGDMPECEYALQPINTNQTVSAPELIYEEGVEYNYSLKCEKDGVETTLFTSTVQLRDIYGRTTTFNGLTVYPTANFDTNVFNVELDYVDTFNAYEHFVLTFTGPSAATAESYEFSLSKTTDIQELDGGEKGMNLIDGTFTYTLTVDNSGYTETLVSSSVTFVDSQGRSSKFNELIFDGTANKLTGEITFMLDFTDDFGFYSDFKITFHDNDLGSDTEIELEETTEEQSFPLTEYNLFFDTSYTYTLTAKYKGETTILQTDTFILSDNSGAVSEVSAPTISSTANYRTRTFQITLNYQDDFDYFDDFVMTVRDVTTNNQTVINLRKTTEPQSVSFSDQRYDDVTGEYVYDIDILDHTVIYTLTYYDSSVDLTCNVVEDETLPAFTNSLETNFNGIVSNWQLVEDPSYPGHYYIPMKLDYYDGKGIYGYLEINMYSGADQVGMIEFQNEEIPEVGEWIAGSVSTSLTLEELTSSPITFKVEGQIMDEKNNYNTVEYQHKVYEITKTLTVADNPEVLALTTDGYASGGELNFQAFFSGQVNEFANTTITIITNEGSYTYTVTLTGIGDYFYIQLNNPSEGDLTDDEMMAAFSEPVTIKFSYCTVSTTGSNTGPGTEVFSDPIEITCYTNFLLTFSV